MKRYSKNNDMPTREAIIGLGESSVRKNYYPELQEKIYTLEKMSSRNNTLIMAIPDLLLVSDTNGYISPFATSSREEATLVLSVIREEYIHSKLKTEIEEVLNTQEPRSFDFELNLSGENKFFEARLHLTELNEVLIIIRDMSERISLENKLRYMAERDYQTGLRNRMKFELSIRQYEKRNDISIGLILFDIDGLKGINDTLGHYEGDKVIKVVSENIEKIFAQADFIARVGGNEFGIAYINPMPRIMDEKCYELQKALELYNKDKSYSFTVSFGISYSDGNPINLDELYQIADHNLYKNKMLKETSSKSALVRTLMNALEAKDYLTEGHAERMTENAIKLGEYLKLETHTIDQITLLTKFHDIGKVGIPDDILKKPGALDEKEWKIMKTHTTIGQRISSVSAELKPISDLILLHHEKWDGSGYPMGLSGDAIPIECRILALVDAFDAMTNDRPYRKALSFDDTINEIIKCKGSHFDPELVDIFLEILSNK